MDKFFYIPDDFEGVFDERLNSLEKRIGAKFPDRRSAEITLFANWKVGPGTDLEVVFDTACVYGTMGEALDYAKNKKSWGKPLAFRPLTDDELDFINSSDPERVGCVLMDNNRIKQKQITRNEYKLLVSAGLVNDAVKMSKKEFLGRLEDADYLEICRNLDITPEEFWRNCKNGNIRHARMMALPDKRRDCKKKHYLDTSQPYGCLDPFL